MGFPTQKYEGKGFRFFFKRGGPWYGVPLHRNMKGKVSEFFFKGVVLGTGFPYTEI